MGKLLLMISVIATIFLGCSSKEQKVEYKKPVVKIDKEKRDRLFNEMGNNLKK